MPTLTLKNIPAELHQSLKLQARRHKRSLNQEALLCLERAVAADATGGRAARLRDREVDFFAGQPDPDRAEWLAQGERRLREVWDNEADDVYHELLEE